MAKYELFYGTGGHGGPYRNFEFACTTAKRLLVAGNLISVYVRERTSGPMSEWPIKAKFYQKDYQ